MWHTQSRRRICGSVPLPKWVGLTCVPASPSPSSPRSSPAAVVWPVSPSYRSKGRPLPISTGTPRTPTSSLSVQAHHGHPLPPYQYRHTMDTHFLPISTGTPRTPTSSLSVQAHHGHPLPPYQYRHTTDTHFLPISTGTPRTPTSSLSVQAHHGHPLPPYQYRHTTDTHFLPISTGTPWTPTSSLSVSSLIPSLPSWSF